MTILIVLIPVSLCLGVVGLAAFMWSLQSGQFDDPAGDAERVLLDVEDKPLAPRPDIQTTRESTP